MPRQQQCGRSRMLFAKPFRLPRQSPNFQFAISGSADYLFFHADFQGELFIVSLAPDRSRERLVVVGGINNSVDDVILFWSKEQIDFGLVHCLRPPMVWVIRIMPQIELVPRIMPQI